jgi:hypothetical protein
VKLKREFSVIDGKVRIRDCKGVARCVRVATAYHQRCCSNYQHKFSGIYLFCHLYC